MMFKKVLFDDFDSMLLSRLKRSYYPPASEASREVVNLTERKNPHTSVYGVKKFVCLSVVRFKPNYLRTG